VVDSTRSGPLTAMTPTRADARLRDMTVRRGAGRKRATATAGRGRGLRSLFAALCVIAGGAGLCRGEVQPVKLSALVATNGVVSLRAGGSEIARLAVEVRRMVGAARAGSAQPRPQGRGLATGAAGCFTLLTARRWKSRRGATAAGAGFSYRLTPRRPAPSGWHHHRASR
jgi:hypothetical protein